MGRHQTPRLMFYGDDFTGSADLVMQYQRYGFAGLIFLGAPDVDKLRDAAERYPVVGIAGVTRAMPPEQIERTIAPALRAFHDLHPDFVQYKVCSTADSSPTIGSFEPAVRLGRELWGARPVPVLVAQPALGRYTAFSNHFAVDRGVVYRLDRQPVMSNHPTTPMREADLRVHIGEQLEAPLGAVTLEDLRRPDRGMSRYDAAAGEGLPAVVIDGMTTEDLRRAGELVLSSAAGGTAFAIGSGGLSTGIAAALGATPSTTTQTIPPAKSPMLAVSGSCSPLTSDQIDRAVRDGWVGVPLDSTVDATLWESELEHAERDALEALLSGRSVIVYTCGEGRTREARPVSVTKVAAGLARVVRFAREERALDRVLIVGGDTSGHVVTELGAHAIVSRGVVGEHTLLFELMSDDPAVDGLEAVLKGGQIGGEDFFELVRTGEGQLTR